MRVREYYANDYEEIITLFYNTIHSVNSVDYTKKQLSAWAPDIESIKKNNKLDERLLRDYSIVVEKDGIIIGFGDVDDTGYFDLLYVHKDYQKKGVATLIADDIENYIRCKGIQTMITAASITAKPFFEKRGYNVLKKQIVESKGQSLINYKMKKVL